MTDGDQATGEERRNREATVERTTAETEIRLRLVLDGSGRAEVSTGVAFFDHMLDSFARHGLFDLEVEAEGDVAVEAHHTVEDVGICLGRAFAEALGTKAGIVRFGSAVIPMDDALVRVAVDLGGRAYCACRFDPPPRMLGTFHTELVPEFFRAWSGAALANLHLDALAGTNSHHMVEAAFKAFARAADAAAAVDPRSDEVPSTKGTL